MHALKCSREIPETETHQTTEPGPDEVDKMECGGEEPGERKDATHVPTPTMKRHDTREDQQSEREQRGSREDTKEAGSLRAEIAQPRRTRSQ
jgi:hypothetical protein